jgi:hypothetical protein
MPVDESSRVPLLRTPNGIGRLLRYTSRPNTPALDTYDRRALRGHPFILSLRTRDE